MPEISRFFGIVIRMFTNDHDPPHFHAIYGEHEVLVALEPPRVLRGEFPRRATALVLEWAELHLDELRYDWTLARTGQPPRSIAPLE